MKAALFTDSHVTTLKGKKLFVETSLQCINKIIDYCEKEDIEYIFFLGDFLFFKDYVESFVLLKIKETLKRLKKFKTRFIVGNHDMILVDESWCNLLTLYDEYITVVNEPYEELELCGNNFIFINYAQNNLIADEKINVKDGMKNVLFCHMDCNGFYTNSVHEMKDSDIEPENLRMFDQVFTGHYHKRSKRYNVQYIGNTHHMRKSDAGNPYGFTVLDLETLDYEFKTYEDYQPPCYYEVNIENTKALRKLKNGFITITVSSEMAETITNERLISLKQSLIKRGNHEVVIRRERAVNIDSVKTNIESNIKNIDVKNTNEHKNLFETYLDNVNTEHDKKELLKKII